MATAYIVVHGFGGTPKDINKVKLELINNNINERNIYTPLLKGHGIKGSIDLTISFKEIINDLKKYINNIKEKYNSVVLIGYSMGGLISLSVAIETKIDKLVLLNAPLHIWNFKNFLWTLYVNDFEKKKYHLKTLFSSFNYNKIRNEIKLKKLQLYLNKNLSAVNCDTLIFQSIHDYVARPISAKIIFKKINSTKKEIIWCDTATHYIPDEDTVILVTKQIVDWVN